MAVVYDRHNRFLAIGFFDPDSPIRLRVLQQGRSETVDRAWWARRLETALERRQGLFSGDTTGYRWINGESDGWPGLALDRYDETLVMKLYTAAWLPWLGEICSLFQERLNPRNLVLRLSRNIQERALTQFGRNDGELLGGDPVSAPVGFLENGLKFEAEVLRGQKTGFFLDQRENRLRVEQIAKGARVLNAFSFSGGFSVYAARGRARSVTDLDASAHALQSGKRNFELNRDLFCNCSREAVQADAFEWLRSCARNQFDLVVLDPPSLARRESERADALRAYGRLVESGIKALSHGGRLVACSCSAHVPSDLFFEGVRSGATRSGRRWQETTRTHQPADHPSSFPEAQYLKAIYLQLRD